MDIVAFGLLYPSSPSMSLKSNCRSNRNSPFSLNIGNGGEKTTRGKSFFGERLRVAKRRGNQSRVARTADLTVRVSSSSRKGKAADRNRGAKAGSLRPLTQGNPLPSWPFPSSILTASSPQNAQWRQRRELLNYRSCGLLDLLDAERVVFNFASHNLLQFGVR